MPAANARRGGGSGKVSTITDGDVASSPARDATVGRGQSTQPASANVP
jgi:hypothetical protein